MFGRNKGRFLIYMAMSLIAGFATGISIKFLYEKSTFKPYHWGSPPVIANCYGEDFSELQMIRAIDYWITREHQIAFYEHNPPASICDSKDMILGFIILRKAKPLELDSGTLADTRRMTSGFEIKSAEIRYRKGSQNLSLINEHELGHALGYTHVKIEGHVMHPIYGKMGPKFWIP